MAGKHGRKKRRSSGARLRPSGSTVSGAKKPAAAKAAPVPPCNYHLSMAAVQSILNHRREPFFIGSYFDNLDEEGKRIVLEAAAEHEKIEDRYAVYQEKVRKEFAAKGFVALPDDYDKRRAAVNAASEETFRRFAAQYNPDGI
jgi:hypothetical protein